MPHNITHVLSPRRPSLAPQRIASPHCERSTIHIADLFRRHDDVDGKQLIFDNHFDKVCSND